MTSNKTPTVIVPSDYKTIDAIILDAFKLITGTAPDGRSRASALDALDDCTDAPNAPIDMLYELHGAFEELHDIAAAREAAANTLPRADKWRQRGDFYRAMTCWAHESFKLTDKYPMSPDTAEPAKDPEDDSDPYVKPAVSDGVTLARELLSRELDKSGFLPERIACALRQFDLESGRCPTATDACDVLELFGDRCVAIGNAADNSPAEARFWDTCVMISDDIRADIAAKQIAERAGGR